MATMSITREIKLRNEDFEKIRVSEPTDLLLNIVKKNNEKQEHPSLQGLTKLVK